MSLDENVCTLEVKIARNFYVEVRIMSQVDVGSGGGGGSDGGGSGGGGPAFRPRQYMFSDSV